MSDAQDAGEPVTPAWMTAGIRQAIRALGSRMTPVAGDAIDLMTLCKMVAQSARTADPQDAGAAAEMRGAFRGAMRCGDCRYYRNDPSARHWTDCDACLSIALGRACIRSLPTSEQTETPPDDEAKWEAMFATPEFVALAKAARDEILFEKVVRDAMNNAPHSAAKVASLIRAAFPPLPPAEPPSQEPVAWAIVDAAGIVGHAYPQKRAAESVLGFMPKGEVNSLRVVPLYLHPAPPVEPETTREPLVGLWPRGVHRAFVEGAKWWEWTKDGATMWASDCDKAEVEAERRYGKVSPDQLHNRNHPQSSSPSQDVAGEAVTRPPVEQGSTWEARRIRVAKALMKLDGFARDKIDDIEYVEDFLEDADAVLLAAESGD